MSAIGRSRPMRSWPEAAGRRCATGEASSAPLQLERRMYPPLRCACYALCACIGKISLSGSRLSCIQVKGLNGPELITWRIAACAHATDHLGLRQAFAAARTALHVAVAERRGSKTKSTPTAVTMRAFPLHSALCSASRFTLLTKVPASSTAAALGLH